jgi:peptide deformylase
VLQHEIDHLDGVLILERAPREQRKGAMRALREGGTFAPERPEPELLDA